MDARTSLETGPRGRSSSDEGGARDDDSEFARRPASKIPLVAERHWLLHEARGGSILAMLFAPLRAGPAHVVVAGPIGVRTAPGLAHPFEESRHGSRVGADAREHCGGTILGHGPLRSALPALGCTFGGGA